MGDVLFKISKNNRTGHLIILYALNGIRKSASNVLQNHFLIPIERV